VISLKPIINLKSISYLLGACSLGLLIVSCNYPGKNNSIRDKVIIYCSEGSPETFNPQLSTSGVTFDASSKLIYNRLIESNSGSRSLESSLATGWSISEDGKSYTFELRKNTEFHSTSFFKPTRPFNADDVLFSFNRQWQKNHTFHSIGSGYPYFYGMGLNRLIHSIEKIDDYTVKFNLTRPESPFLATLSMDFASILSAEYAQNLAKKKQHHKIDSHPIGTGPYQLTRYQTNEFIRYKAHPKFWQGQQKLKSLVFAITPDPSLRFARLVSGECDVMSNPLPIHLASLKEFSHIQTVNESGLNTAYFAMNTEKAPFNNQKVRLAFNHAINKDAIIRAVFQKTAVKAKSIIPPAMWSHDSSLRDYDYNPEKARQLIIDAGFPAGLDIVILISSAQRSYNPNAKKMAELIQQNLNAINVRAEIISYEHATFLRSLHNGNHQAALSGWIADNNDPDNFFSNLLTCSSSTNDALWCNKKFDQLILNARLASDKFARKKLYIKAQRKFKDAVPLVPISHATHHVIFNPRVKNLKLSMGSIKFDNAYIEIPEKE